MKKTSLFENALIWFGAGVSIAEILTGTYLAPLGLKNGILAIVAGHVIGCILLFLAGVIGGKMRLSAHPSNIKNITLSYKDSNGNWVNIDSNGNQIIPGNAKIKLNVDYFNINIDQLISTDEYSQCITYIIPDLLSNAQTVGIITQDSEEVGKLAVQNGVVSLKFKCE